MESLPSVKLGAGILLPFLAALAVRPLAEKRWVITAGLREQPKRQFMVDFGLAATAGLMFALGFFVIYGYMPSGLLQWFGYTILGFFMALDMALDRERKVIYQARELDEPAPPPETLFPVTRKFSLITAGMVLFATVVLALVISGDLSWLSDLKHDPHALAEAQWMVMLEILFVMAVLMAMVMNLVFSYSRNMKLLFENQTGVLGRVTNGDLSSLVPIATNDEFGVIAGYTNTMIHGLRDRIQLISSLQTADAVQKSLLPQSAPSVPGLDVAGGSDYCDRTGGDYFDYFDLPGGHLGVAVADACGHGVSSALHMATARAFLRSRVSEYRGPAILAEEANRFLARDISRDGWFLTLFFLDIDPRSRQIRWVRAGHEPAWLYDPARGEYETLFGEGMALGIFEDNKFVEYTHNGWEPGDVLAVVSDGILEAHNGSGEMYGKERLRDAIRRVAELSSEEIRQAILREVEDFRGDLPPEDDVTLVVIKLL